MLKDLVLVEIYTENWFVFVLLTLLISFLFLIIVLLRNLKRLKKEIKVKTQALDFVSAFIYIKGLDHKYVFANKPTLELFKVTKDELPGSPDDRFFPPDAVAELYRVDQIVLEKGEVSQKEIFVIESDGSKKIYWETKHPLVEKNGKIIGLVGISTDITKRKLTEDSLLASESELRRLNQTKDKFFSILAHDLRGPISNFSGGLKYLSEENSDASPMEKAKILESLKESSESIFTLLENLLDWSKAQSGNIRFKPEFMNLIFVVEETLDLLKISLTNKKIEVITHFPDTIEVFADPNMMKIILRNLISNSIKFSYESGKIEIYGNNDGNFFIFEIKDFGMGMDSETIQNLFQIGISKSRFGTKQEKGSGLGLILCHDYIDINGGKILVQSEPGIGTSFKLYIPNQKP